MLRDVSPPPCAAAVRRARIVVACVALSCACSLPPRVVQTAQEPVLLDAGVAAGGAKAHGGAGGLAGNAVSSGGAPVGGVPEVSAGQARQAAMSGGANLSIII